MAEPRWRSLLCALIVTALVSCAVVASGKPRPAELMLRDCRGPRVQDEGAYRNNFLKVTEVMARTLKTQRYAFGEFGEPANKIYVLFQCMGDVDGEECIDCFNRVVIILPSCFPSSAVRILYGGCFMRTEQYSFFRNAIEPGDDRFTKCGDTIDASKKFNLTVTGEVNEVVKMMRSPENNFSMVFRRSPDVFVLATGSCWETLSLEDCKYCIGDAAKRALSCLPSTEARAMNSGCVVRYADYDFSNHPENNRAKEILMIYVSYILGGLVVSTLIVAVGMFVARTAYKRNNRTRRANGAKRLQISLSVSEKGNFLEFNSTTLEKATEGFDEFHRLGQGGYGEVYKGTLADGREIAVKRLFAGGKTQNDEICNEIDIISRAQHKNLVRFLGCCFTNADSFLVYEFLVNQSLDRILFDSERRKELDWKKRKQIIMGTAEGLEYLHKGCQLRIIHRDIKASNILLDSKFRPKISDFGLARFSSCGRNISSATISGTFGYLAPEYLAQGRLTEKVDVYSFGVLVFEIVSGMKNNKLWSESSSETLVSHVWRRFQSDTIVEIVEEELEIGHEVVEEEIKRVIQVGLLCTQESPDLRPNMTMVIQMLKQGYEFELPMPTKPPFIDEHLEFSSLGSFRWQPSCIGYL